MVGDGRCAARHIQRDCGEIGPPEIPAIATATRGVHAQLEGVAAEGQRQHQCYCHWRLTVQDGTEKCQYLSAAPVIIPEGWAFVLKYLQMHYT